MTVTNSLIKRVSTDLLETLKGEPASAGEVDKLSETIAEALVNDRGVSKGVI